MDRALSQAVLPDSRAASQSIGGNGPPRISRYKCDQCECPAGGSSGPRGNAGQGSGHGASQGEELVLTGDEMFERSDYVLSLPMRALRVPVWCVIIMAVMLPADMKWLVAVTALVGVLFANAGVA